MLVLVIALAVVIVLMVFVCVTLDGLVNSVTVPCVPIIAHPMESVMKLLQYVLVFLVILVSDATAFVHVL